MSKSKRKSKTATARIEEPMSEFWTRMHADGCDMKHVRAMCDRVLLERAEAMSKAAALYFDPFGAKMTTVKVVDKLAEMVRRADGLYLTTLGMSSNHPGDDLAQALSQCASDFADELRRLSEAAAAMYTVANQQGTAQ